jgi:hypothetical protein
MKKIFLFVLLAVVGLSSCKKKEPYDLQSPDDNPLILIPYEGDNGTAVNVEVTNPNPYVDSVVVVPSSYTTVNWYLDKVLVYTGTKINKAFPTGTYELLIEAVTTAGKRTTRSGKLVVSAAATDPYVSTRVLAPGVTMTLEGKNLGNVKKVILAKDFYGKDTVCTVVPTIVDATKANVILPKVEDGSYYLCLLDNEDVLFGSDKLTVQDSPMALSGFNSFSAGEPWVITGVNLKNVASVKVGDLVITALTVTNTTVTLTAPDLAEGEYTLSMKNADGSDVLFYTSSGMETEVKVRSSAVGETTIWEGSCVIDWGDANVHVDKSKMAGVPAGAQIYVYYNVPSAEYHSLRVVVAPDWSADIVPQVDGMDSQPSPYKFIYDDASKAKAEADDKDGILVTGFGLEIIQITYK